MPVFVFFVCFFLFFFLLQVRILFQETNYGHRESKYIVLCIDQPLEGGKVTAPVPQHCSLQQWAVYVLQKVPVLPLYLYVFLWSMKLINKTT